MSSIRRIIVAASGLILLTSLLAVAPAAAAHVTCGQVITSSVTLDSDLFCPTGDGLVVEGSGIVLNLNGRSIRGELDSRTVSQPGALGDNGVLGAPYTTRFAKGQFAGIRVRGVGNVIVGGGDRVRGQGSVRQFAAGVVIEGGGRNTVTRLVVEENMGPPVSAYLGDGILINNSSGNRIGFNTVRNNGAYDGIGILGGSVQNIVHNNTVIANTVPEVCPDFDVFQFSVSGGGVQHFCGPTHPTRGPFTFVNQQNHGIKLEQGANGSAGRLNSVQGNIITGNGNSGIFVTTTCPDLGEPGQTCFGEPHSDNTFTRNVASHNGFGYPAGLPDRRMFEGLANGGGGITIMLGGPKPAIRSTVSANIANDNARDGIAVLPHRPGTGNTMSRFLNNTALRNNAAPFPGPALGARAFNGYDGNADITPATPCDNNVWSGNNFGSSPADIHGPIPYNNLTNHPCVGPVLPGPAPAQALSAAGSSPAPTDTRLFRHRTFAPRPG